MHCWQDSSSKNRSSSAAAALTLRVSSSTMTAAEPRLEPLGGDLSIACFRYRPPHATSPDAVDAVNRRVVERLVAEGRCYLSPTTLDGRFALRACIVNFRTRREDVDLLVDEVLRLGERAAR